MDDELRKLLVQIMEGQEALRLEVKDDIREVKDEIKEIKEDVKKLGAKIDGEVMPKVEALFDGYKANTEKLQQLGEKVDDLRLDMNNITIKTARNDSNIVELNRRLSSM